MRHPLIPHPRTPCQAVTRLEVETARDGDALTLRYLLTGNPARLVIPGPSAANRVDGLWEHLCFEAFVAGNDGGYREFNASPSTAWAAYRFDGYRQGMAPLQIDAPQIETTATGDTLEVRFGLILPPGPVKLGLTAVIEETGGRMSYWALRHPAEHPDFHDAGGFVLAV